MIRYLIFLIFFALVIAIFFPLIKRWLTPIFSYGKNIENKSFGKFEKYLDDKENVEKKKPVKKKVKK